MGYPKYKASGVEYVDDVPDHWDIDPVKRHFSIQLGKMLQNEPKGSSDVRVNYLKAQHVQWFKVNAGDPPKMWSSKDEIEKYGIESGDLLVCEGGEGGRSGILTHINGPCIIQNALHRVRSKRTGDNQYLIYVLNHIAASGWFDVLNDKATIAHFTNEKFRALKVPLPPLPEQRAIARYLDYIDDRIQRYIRAKERLIELLEEQKRAVINRAVTRGLDPDVPLKPSGVEWLGDIPAHWEVSRLHTISKVNPSNVDKHVYENEAPVHLCNYVDVYKNDEITSDLPFMAATAKPEEIEKFQLRENDVLITKDSETWDDIGVPALVADSMPNVLCGYHLAVLRPTEMMLGGYLAWSIRSDPVAYQFHIVAKGVTRYGISRPGLQSVHVPMPPIEEQSAIFDYVKSFANSVESSQATAKRQIELIREYRTRLIADVVTGKLDVRDAAANLPDGVEEDELSDRSYDPNRLELAEVR